VRNRVSMFRRSLFIIGYFAAFSSAFISAAAQRMITSQYDNARAGANLGETILNPRNVNPRQFGKLFTLKVDGDIYAQPLFLGGVDFPGKGRHDTIFIATEHDSVYAFDAYGSPATPLWQVSLLKKNVTPVRARNVECPFIFPEVGITSTPVIDAESGTLANRRPLIEIPRADGLPDGMTVDAEGCLWVALFYAGKLRRYAPDGRAVMDVELPVTLVTSCAFGGANLDELFITTARHRLGPAQAQAQHTAGGVFVCRPGVTGRPPFLFGARQL